MRLGTALKMSHVGCDDIRAKLKESETPLLGVQVQSPSVGEVHHRHRIDTNLFWSGLFWSGLEYKPSPLQRSVPPQIIRVRFVSSREDS